MSASVAGRERSTVLVPSLYEVQIQHARSSPRAHRFSYRSYQWLIDIDAPPPLPRLLRTLASFRGVDHFGGGASIRAGLEAFLATRELDLDGGRVLMLANARVLGYGFNPLSVFWCYHRDGPLLAVVAEVHNTYGQRHAYLLRTDDRGRASTAKQFYVSPFHPVDGEYQMSLPEPADQLTLTITLHRPGAGPFVASVRGRRSPATAGNVLRAALRHPLAPAMGSLRIRRQGVALWLRRLPVVPRPPHSQEGIS